MLETIGVRLPLTFRAAVIRGGRPFHPFAAIGFAIALWAGLVNRESAKISKVAMDFIGRTWRKNRLRATGFIAVNPQPQPPPPEFRPSARSRTQSRLKDEMGGRP